jgi:hypothetical protein
MPYLNNIATKLNELFSASTLTDKRFAGSDWNPIAYPVMVDNRDGEFQKIAPCVPTTAGEYKLLIFDDTKPLIVYHKVIGKRYQEEKGVVYGRSSGKNLSVGSSMQMIVLANRNLIKILPEDLETLLTTNFPDGSETGFKNINSALNGIAIKVTNSDLGYDRLWSQEYKGFEFQVNPDRAILSVNYTIESSFKTKCFKLCDCAGESGQ